MCCNRFVGLIRQEQKAWPLERSKLLSGRDIFEEAKRLVELGLGDEPREAR